MRRQLVEPLQIVGAQAPVQAGAEALGGLGRVLGDVAGYLLSRQLPRLVVARCDVAHVELLAPTGIPVRPPIVQGWTRHPHARDRLAKGILEKGGGERLGWWGQTAGTAAVGGGVQAHDRVEVDRSASLELGHLGVADPHQPAQLGLVQTHKPAEGTLDRDGGTPPQLGGQGVPEHLSLAVVAGGAQRLAQPRIIFAVAVPAAIPVAVRAAGTLPVGVAGQHEPPLGLAGVDAAEAGGGEGHKQPRMPGHGLGDALAALQPGGEELVGIRPIGGRTRWAA
jgi:hypothetical protein